MPESLGRNPTAQRPAAPPSSPAARRAPPCAAPSGHRPLPSMPRNRLRTISAQCLSHHSAHNLVMTQPRAPHFSITCMTSTHVSLATQSQATCPDGHVDKTYSCLARQRDPARIEVSPRPCSSKRLCTAGGASPSRPCTLMPHQRQPHSASLTAAAQPAGFVCVPAVASQG